MRKTILLFLVLLLVFTCTAFAKVKTYDVYGPRSGWHDDKWEGYLLTWTTGGLDSLYISILSDTAAVDEDTTNAFEVVGLFSANPRDTVGVLILTCSADTLVDSVQVILDYSYDGTTWFAGTYSDVLSTSNPSGVTDTILTPVYILANPGVSQGCQVFAPLWRARAKVTSDIPAISGRVPAQKWLTSFRLNFYAGGR